MQRCHFQNKLLSTLLVGIFIVSGNGMAETVNIDELPHKELILPNGTRSTIIIYGEHNWRDVDVSIFTGVENTDRDVCFEAKFDSFVAPDKIKLFGSQAVLILNDRARFKTLSAEFKRNDNVWFAGETHKSKDGKTLELHVIHAFKQPPDLQKYEQRITSLEKNNSFDALIELGHKIEQLRNGGNFSGLDDYDKLGALKNKAFETGLTLKELVLKRDDADGLFTVAMQWKELLRKTSKFRTLVERVLSIDPNHPRAQRFVEELGLVKFEEVWRHKEDVDKIQAQRKLETDRNSKESKAALEAHQKEVLKAVAEREILIHRFQMDLRTRDPQARQSAVIRFGDAVGKSLDAGFGREAIEILTHLSDATATAGLSSAARSTFAEIRREVYESLVWRGSQNQLASFDALIDILKIEKDTVAARGGIDALVSLGGKHAVKTLIATLGTTQTAIRDEVLDGLKIVTKQSFTTNENWQDWWSKNKDSF